MAYPPTLTLSIAFTTAPLATPSWTDVTAYWLQTATLSRGRNRELEQTSTGTLDNVVLDNRTGRFDPTYTSGAYYPNVLPMRRIKLAATVDAVTSTLFTGFIERWVLNLDTEYSTVTVQAVDGFDILAAALLPPADYPAELTGTRVTRVLNAAGWPSADRSIDVGQVMVAETTMDGTTSALSHLQAVTDTEGGHMFMTGAGAFAWHDSAHRIMNGSVQVIMGDAGSGGEQWFSGVVPSYDRDDITNQASVTAASGSDVAENPVSRTAYGPREKSYSTLMTSTLQAGVRARDLVETYATPSLRVDEIQFRPVKDQTLWGHAAAREIGDRITFKRRPVAGNTINTDHVIESVKHDFRGYLDLTTTWQVSPAPSLTSYWLLNDATYGLLGSTTILAPL